MATAPSSGARLVVRDGSVLSEQCEGFADAATGRGWTPDTPSQIASISKQFVACVALILADQGVLGLDDRVSSLLPGCPAQWSRVSVRQLLNHTSGMRHWGELPGFDPSQTLDPGDRLACLLEAPLSGEPGRSWLYSSPGYVVLGAVLARAAQRPYAALVHTYVLDPLRLDATSVGSAPDGVARGYRDGVPVPTWPLHTMPGTGDICSTARDLARFLTALHTGALLPGTTQSVLYGDAVDLGDPVDPGDQGGPPAEIVLKRYGLGHFRATVDRRAAFLHPGDNPGYQALAAWLPDTRTVAVALSNDEADDLERCVVELLRRADHRDVAD